jgi:hypothetical protein
MSIDELEKQLADILAEQKEYRQNYRNVVGPRSAYDIADYNYAVLQFRRKYGDDNYFDRIRDARQQLDAARKAAATPPPADTPPADNPPANNPPADNPPSDTLSVFDMINKDKNKISTEQDLLNEVGKLAAGTGIPEVNSISIAENQDEIQKTAPSLIPAQTPASTTQANTSQIVAPVPTVSTSNIGNVQQVERIAPQVGQMEAATTTVVPQIDFSQVQGQVSSGSIATAAQAELDPRGTTQYQLSQLLSSIEEGQPMPPWAAPAVRKIAGVMQARGLGGSSMAAAAMTQAVMESGVVIATQDANKYATVQLQNLNNQQQAALQNAATYAGMDKANLSARLQSAVTNAQSLLAIETKNLNNRQQANTLSFNALTQAMFKDAAEENARQQFNAKNDIQVEEFFAQLGSQVETANANRVAAMEQFNANESNAMTQFNASLRDARDKFNANMSFAIDQSNVQWRRQINTANTAVQNETNRINVQNSLNVSQNALNNLWQAYRDEAAWTLQKSESALQRQHEIGIMGMEFANTKELYNKEQKDNLALGIGNWIATWMAQSQ